MLRSLALVFLLVPWSSACAVPADSAQEEPPRKLVVTLVGEAAALENRLQEEDFFRWAGRRLQGWTVTVRAGAGVPEPAGAGAEVFVVLLPAAGVQDRLHGLPVALSGDRVELAGTAYEAREVALTVRFPGDPERRLVASADPDRLVAAADRALLHTVGARFWGDDPERDLDYEVRASRWLRRTGAWRLSGGGWELDPASERDDIADRARRLASLRPIEAGAVRLLVPPGREGSAALRELAADLGRAAVAMAPRVPVDPEALRRRPLTVVVETDHVAQARHADAVGMAVPGRPSGLAEDGVPPDLHLVHHPDDGWAYRHALARSLLARAGAADAPPLLRAGAALWLAEGESGAASRATAGTEPGGWYGLRSERWIPALAAADVLPGPAELLGGEPAGDASEVLWTPAAAAVVGSLSGRTALARLEAADEAAVREALAELAAAASRPPEPPARAPLHEGFLRGVSFAMLNSLEGGYHAPRVEASLGRLAELGADAVSLMPFAYQPRPDAPEMRFLNDAPASETDAGLVHAARAAHTRGFTVLWKPHLWLRDGNWPGDVAMTSEEDWRAWWRSYRRYVLHHAVLARYAGTELFAVGVELEKTVERREDWVRLIQDVRRVYPGAVTYAANWGMGADRVTFWDALDVAGVDAYYPLAQAAEASDGELRRGAGEAVRRLEAVARRAGKPLILTEVGFPARQAAWRAPHEEGGDLSEEDQARAYRALLPALEGRSWLRGVFVWKAFSGEWTSRGRGDRPDFRFVGRPSEAIVAEFFGGVAREGGAAPGRP